MNEEIRNRKIVKRIKQRAEKRSLGIDHLRDLNSCDIEYSPAGQILKQVNYTFGGSKHSSGEFHYGNDGKLRRTDSFDAADALIGISYVEYDKYGNETGWKVYLPNGELTRWGQVKIANGLKVLEESFGKNGLPVTRKSFAWSVAVLSGAVREFYGRDGQLTERWVENYDQNGRLIETFGLKPDDTPLGDGRYTYEYDEYGRESKIWAFNDLSQEGTPSSVQVCEYDLDACGEWSEKRRFYQSRNDERWTVHVTKREIEYYD